ncbi:alginate O-acetyltransferase AlgX-related protein [Muricoccus radiodurans]|uniref:alginate O-acetyltransferase AlgX-related protein n=1 Tax=Muricoccus radiodurans TaxID=2231721 RepID=UPI003CE78C16
MTTPPVHQQRILNRRSLLTASAAVGLGALSRPALANTVNGIVLGKDGWLFAQWDAQGMVSLDRVRRMVALIVETAGILRRSGVEMAVSIPPSRARTYRDFLPDGMRIAAPADQRLSLALRDLRAAGLVAPDLYALFTRFRAASPNDPLFFRADTHWTPQAAEAAAVEVARAIQERHSFPPPSRPASALPEPTRMQHVNDLASMLPAADRARYPTQPFNVRQANALFGGAALLDEEASDITVVGSSFMHPRYGFSAMLSHELARPVGLTWAVHQNGPYRTLLEHLNGEGFKRHRPKLVVWNILELDLESMPDRADIWRNNAMSAPNFLAEVRRTVEA